ncbi:10369_t:CDS:2, partial [Paraglomus brasilianum]
MRSSMSADQPHSFCGRGIYEFVPVTRTSGKRRRISQGKNEEAGQSIRKHLKIQYVD